MRNNSVQAISFCLTMFSSVTRRIRSLRLEITLFLVYNEFSTAYSSSAEKFHMFQPDKISDMIKDKPFADDKNLQYAENDNCLSKGRKHCGKRRKCW